MFALFAPCAVGARAADAWPRTFVVGYQKYGTLIILKSRGDLEKRLAPYGVEVKWAEFFAGAPILEAMNGGAVDFGITGETPPVFAQAAEHSVVRYVAYEPAAPAGEAILVPRGSPARSVADLKGKTIGVARGSNAQYLLVRALQQAGLAWGDVNVSYLNLALGALGATEAVGHIGRCTRDDISNVRKSAVLALAAIGDRSAEPFLAAAAADPDAQVRKLARQAMGQLRH